MWEILSSSWAIGAYVVLASSVTFVILWYVYIPKIRERNLQRKWDRNLPNKKESSYAPQDREPKLESKAELERLSVGLDEISLLLQKIVPIVSDLARSNKEVLERMTDAFERIQGASSQLMRLLQKSVEILININEAINSNQNRFEKDLYDPSRKIITPDSSIPIVSGITVVNEIELSPSEFDELIQRNKENIIQASSRGKRDLEALVRRLADQLPIELDCPSDQVFVITSHSSKSAIQGKAFVFPGSYLGRPWVEWFEMPLGVYERVESTVVPATVSKNPTGIWSLVKTGRVSQR